MQDADLDAERLKAAIKEVRSSRNKPRPAQEARLAVTCAMPSASVRTARTALRFETGVKIGAFGVWMALPKALSI